MKNALAAARHATKTRSAGQPLPPAALALCVPLETNAQDAENDGDQVRFVGDWTGTLDLGAMQLRLRFVLSAEEGALSGVLYSVDQGNAEFPIATLETSGDTISMSMSPHRGRLQGYDGGGWRHHFGDLLPRGPQPAARPGTVRGGGDRAIAPPGADRAVPLHGRGGLVPQPGGRTRAGRHPHAALRGRPLPGGGAHLGIGPPGPGRVAGRTPALPRARRPSCQERNCGPPLRRPGRRRLGRRLLPGDHRGLRHGRAGGGGLPEGPRRHRPGRHRPGGTLRGWAGGTDGGSESRPMWPSSSCWPLRAWTERES